MSKRKFVKTDYDQIVLREDDKIIHLDAESLAELYWEVKDKKLVRVVNCKDCKHREVQVDGVFRYEMCGLRGEIINLEGFCHMGKRRNDG
ncbi:MAG: hypothetical protein IIZ78_26055 [Clostridiales bacterium]|nr:hypothetical protein [Clostridiales bacterium]